MPTQEQQNALLAALTAAQLACGATAEQFATYLGALVAAAVEANLSAQDVGAIVTVGGLTTKISAINAQIEVAQDEFDAHRGEHQDEVAALNAQKATLQAALKAVGGG